MFGKKDDKSPPRDASGVDLKTLSDGELLEYVAFKSEAAFDEIVKRYEKFVYSAVFCELRNEEDTFDVSQEVFIRLWNAAGGFRCESTLKTWLYRMCKNCAYDYMRKFYKHKTFSLTKADDDEEGSQTDVETEDSPEEIILQREREKEVRRAIYSLPEEQREVIVLREMQDMSYSEISELLGISEGTVKSRISRGRASLKQLLAHLIT